MVDKENILLNEKLDHIIALLKVLAKKEVDEFRKSVFSTGKKRMIYDLCDGKTEILEMAKKAGVTRQYLHATLGELEEAGFVIIGQKGRKRYPKKVM